MKTLIAIIVLTATTAFAQVPTGETPVLTNGISVSWGAEQRGQLTTLYKESTNAIQQAWQGLGAKPAPPVLPSFIEWMRQSVQGEAGKWLASQWEQRLARISATVPTRLLGEGWELLTDAQRLSISNTLQTAVSGRWSASNWHGLSINCQSGASSNQYLVRQLM
jgi:hypothetical protein